MEGHNIVAIYGSRIEAERARDRLIEIGIPATDIRMSAGEWGTTAGASDVAPPASHREGFWDWLFGSDMPENDRSWYETNLREGRTALSVFVRDTQQHDRVEEVIEEFHPIDFEDAAAAGLEPLGERGESLGSTEAWNRGVTGSRSAEGLSISDTSARSMQSAVQPGIVGSGERTAIEPAATSEQVIPVVREELAVGKRVSERRYRIRTYVVETPVEKEVMLRDERVIVEHRPVSGAAAPTAQMPQQREFEVVERHEEPVVEKRARNVEEVVVRTDASERTETVRDTVRQTRVDVENEAGERADNLERPVPDNRNP